jgi:hypothetical protein
LSFEILNRPDALWSVAPRLGIDLSQAIRSERMTPQDLSDMLRNCALCWHTRKCARWAREPGEAAAEMPAYCPSREGLQALAAGRAVPCNAVPCDAA